MRIGVFCTNEYTTPPPKNVIYAPLVVAQQVADGLAKKGHDVTMYAPKGSRAVSNIFTNNIPSLYKNPKLKGFVERNIERSVASYESLALYTMIQHANQGKFDVLHIHPAIRGIFFAGLTTVPSVFTIHDPVIEGKKFFYERVTKRNIKFVSISNAQRKPAPKLPWTATVYNGTDMKKFTFNPNPKKHFTIIGRLTKEKGIYEAIMAAKKARVPLKIAGGPMRGPYWERKIKPHLSKTIQHVGMIPYKQVSAFLGQARGFLFPIQWEEPFGLVMTESMACGTPVIAFPRGSVREIMRDKKTGYIVKDVPQMVKSIHAIDKIDRQTCRTYVEKNFSVEKMVDEYEKVFTRLTKHHGKKKR